MDSTWFKVISGFQNISLDPDRKELINQLIDYLEQKIKSGETAKLNFICTHNSRRSQFSQLWGGSLAVYFGLPIECYSGGVEVTEFNPRAVEALNRDGFIFSETGGSNPVYKIKTDRDDHFLVAFSKVYNDPTNPKEGFAAVMTCDHADENCPIIIGADARIPLRYEDPKRYDNTAQEANAYSKCSHQIGAELHYCFSELKNRLSKT